MPKTSVDPDLLYAAFDEARKAKGLSWRSLATEIGVSPSLLSRLGQGMRPDANGFATLVTWLNVPAETFFETEDDDGAERDEPELMARLAPLLRADKNLRPEDVKFISDIVSAAVDRARAAE